MDNPFGSSSKVLNPFGNKIDEAATKANDLQITTALDKPNEPFHESNEFKNTDSSEIELAKSKAEMKTNEKIRKQKALDEQRIEERERKKEILEENGGLESNIPINSEYWNLRG